MSAHAAGSAAPWRRSVHGFNLLELMVVVAVISILAAIGMVNLITAQDRARVAVVHSDLRLLATALASYQADQNSFPIGARGDTIEDFERLFVPVALTALTTPVAYLSSLMSNDPFNGARTLPTTLVDSLEDAARNSYVYIHYPDFSLYRNNPALWKRAFCVASHGPDQSDSYAAYRLFPDQLPAEATALGIRHVVDTVYDPTNGAHSGGDIAKFGGEIEGLPGGN